MTSIPGSKTQRSFLLLISFILFPALVFGQGSDAPDEREPVQLSGVVVKDDSITPVPFTNILIKGSNRGTTTDPNGYFSFVAQEQDTIIFSSVGFRKGTFIVPDTLQERQYSLIHVLKRDTVQLEEAVVHPWPTREEFKQAFLNLDLPDDDLERARKNLADAKLRDMAREVPMDAQMNFKYQMQQKMNRLYYAGQTPPIRLLDPFAWSKFIKAWKNGEFKQDSDQ